MTDVDPSPPVQPAPPSASHRHSPRTTWSAGRADASSPGPSDRSVGAAVDSRLVEPGQVFVALPGERTDGHAYLSDAIARGAAAVIVARPVGDPGALGDVSAIRVADPLAALGAVATGWRRRFDPLVVGVTGSIAKTSTKEAVAAVLGRRFRTLRNEGNQNNEIGLPLTVLRLRPGARGRRPRDGDVRRRRDRRPRADRAATDRRRDRGPGRPPVADRLARGDRAGQGRAARGAPARRRGRPERRRPDRPADGRPDGGAVGQLRLRGRRRRRRRGGRVARPRRDALRCCGPHGVPTTGHDPGPRPAVGPQRARGGRGRPRRRADRSTRSRPASPTAGRRRIGSRSSGSAA